MLNHPSGRPFNPTHNTYVYEEGVLQGNQGYIGPMTEHEVAANCKEEEQNELAHGRVVDVGYDKVNKPKSING